MKQWLGFFSAALIAGLIVLFAYRSMQSSDRDRATWIAETEKLAQEMRKRSIEAEAETSPGVRLALKHLIRSQIDRAKTCVEQAPRGVSTSDLENRIRECEATVSMITALTPKTAPPAP